MHDAGGLTRDEENAWSMNILENELADGSDDVPELPPSYFEATGIRDD